MNKYQKRIFWGTLYAILSGIIWAVCGILGEYFFEHYTVTSGWITSMRLVVAGIIVLVISACQSPKHFFDIWKEPKNYPFFLFYAICGIFSVQFFYYLCIEYSNVTTAAILQFVSPVFILLYNVFVRKQRVSKQAVLYMFLAMMGVFLMATKGDLSTLAITPFALLIGLLSALAVMFNVILPQRFSRRYGAMTTVGWGMLLAGFLSNMVYPIAVVPFELDTTSIFISLVIALFGTALAFLVSMKAVSMVSPLVVSVVGASEPLSAAFLSIVFLGMSMDWSLGVAMLLIIVPMVLLSIEESKMEDEYEHEHHEHFHEYPKDKEV